MLLITRKLLPHEFQVETSNLKATTITWLTVTEYLCHKWLRVCFLSRNHNPVLLPFMTYHLISNKSNKSVERELPTLPELMSLSYFKSCSNCSFVFSNFLVLFFSFSFFSTYLFSLDLRLLITRYLQSCLVPPILSNTSLPMFIYHCYVIYTKCICLQDFKLIRNYISILYLFFLLDRTFAIRTFQVMSPKYSQPM